MDDFSSDQTTTGRLQLGILSHGVIETPGDTDWFAVELAAGTIYRFQQYGDNYFGKTLQRNEMELFDADGNFLVRSTPGSRNPPNESGVTYTPKNSGTHYIAADPAFDFTGSYAFKLDTIAPETGDTINDALALTLGTPINLVDNSSTPSISLSPEEARDEDWLSINLEAGTDYALEINQVAYISPSTEAVRGEVLTATGDVIALTASSNPLGYQTARFTASESGIHYINAIGSSARMDSHYSVTVRETVTVTGTDGSDWLTVPENTDLAATAISGGAGEDMISFAAREGISLFGDGVLVNLDNGLVSARAPGYMRLVMEGIEHATGSSANDTLYGHDGNERLRGLGGEDRFIASTGADTINGGGGRDTLDFLFANEGVSVSLLRGTGWAGDAHGDRISNVENIAGSIHDDSIWGDHGSNRLEGSYGDDTLVGNGGDDYILAGFGTDVVIFSGNRADYTVTQDGIRTDVIDNVGSDGHDILGHAEILRFADGDFIL
ncbi:hypothetical protein JYP51_22675 [Ponticoccus gilvus]|nr:hypothetical protein [Enemella evansiae]